MWSHMKSDIYPVDGWGSSFVLYRGGGGEPALTLVLLVANLANTKRCKKLKND